MAIYFKPKFKTEVYKAWPYRLGQAQTCFNVATELNKWKKVIPILTNLKSIERHFDDVLNLKLALHFQYALTFDKHFTESLNF